MFASRPAPCTNRRKPYAKPILTKLTPGAAKTILEARSVPGDEHAEELLRVIRSQLEKQKQ
jgi:hypothetical protein